MPTRNPSKVERKVVLLLHECGADSHYDLMMESPSEASERVSGTAAAPDTLSLLTWRIAEPSWRWAELGTMRMERIADHRRDYLNFEGELTGGRGRVRRVDEGTATVREWHETGGVLELAMNGFSGVVQVSEAGGSWWLMRVSPR